MKIDKMTILYDSSEKMTKPKNCLDHTNIINDQKESRPNLSNVMMMMMTNKHLCNNKKKQELFPENSVIFFYSVVESFSRKFLYIFVKYHFSFDVFIIINIKCYTWYDRKFSSYFFFARKRQTRKFFLANNFLAKQQQHNDN